MKRSRHVRIRQMVLLLGGAVLVAPGGSAAVTLWLPFWEDFEPTPDHWAWTREWRACDRYVGDPYCPYDPMLPLCEAPEECSARYGPLKFESWPDAANGGHVFSGQRSGRQPIWDPYWGAILHPFVPPPGRGDLHVRLWQYEPATIFSPDDDPWGPPPRPNFQIQGWVVLTDPYRTEYYVLGVNSHQSWTHVSWCTRTDAWNTTAVERVEGWRKLEIVVHPYTGGAGDVEFLVDDAVVAQGHRMPGGGNGVPVSWLRLGGDPALIVETHLTNSFEEFWYDEVELTFTFASCYTPAMDFYGDSDVDQDDFGLFQSCLTGADDPQGVFNTLYCTCADADQDADVDEDDFAVFQACLSGADVPANPNCDVPAPP